MSSSSSQLSPLEALKAGFRRACVRRLVGDESGAVRVLRDEIPALVVGWAKVSQLDPSEKKAKLKELFDDESARADELATAFDLFAGRFEVRMTAIIREQLGAAAARSAQSEKKSSKTLASAKRTTKKEPADDLAESASLAPGEDQLPESEECVDPPRGMGLKFDEIEKMIDEVLAFDK